MVSMKSKYNGEWLDTKKLSVKDTGVWKDAKRAYIKDNGEWKEIYNNLADKKSCKELFDAGQTTDGVYTINPTGTSPFEVYCNMTTDGGGWTLVWSHMLNVSNYPANNLPWTTAITTEPLLSTTISSDKQAFQVYTGLELWGQIGNGEMMYEWATSGKTINQRAVMNATVGNASNNYTLSITSITNTVGTVSPGLYAYHNNRPFTATNNDNDAYSINCANNYGGTPWWYGACWSGNISGGGGQSTHSNGAFWTGSSNTVNGSTGTGGGNGWIYVR